LSDKPVLCPAHGHEVEQGRKQNELSEDREIADRKEARRHFQ
jgi:hypothetical protein